MKSHLGHFEGDFSITIDEDLPLSCKLSKLNDFYKRQLSKDEAFNLDETTIKKMNFSELVKITPFQRSLSETLASTKSELATPKASCMTEWPESQKTCISKNSFKTFPGGILKSEDKSKYKNWRQISISDLEYGLIANKNLDPDLKLIHPYFVYGNGEPPVNWDNDRWKEEEEWWENSLWMMTSQSEENLVRQDGNYRKSSDI